MDLFSEAEQILISSSSREPLDRRAHVTSFAFLLGAGRQACNNDTVLATKDSAELARFFSKRYLNDRDAISIPPPSISSSSLLIHGKSGKDFTVNNSKGSLQQLAILNMSSKFYTTPDSAFYTPKTILRNVKNGMEELMESRLKSTLLQLAQKSAERGVQRHMSVLFRLISPSQNPLHIATILTQFVSPEHVNCEHNVEDTDKDLVKLTLEFKAIIDVVIFGDVKRVELRGPVSISAKFDPSDNLLSAIDIKFDCETLLMSMIANARMLVNTLIKKTAVLSIGIAKYREQQNASALAVAHILAGKSPSVHSLGSVSLRSGSLCSNLSNLFSSLSSFSGSGSAGCRHPDRSSHSSSSRGGGGGGLRRTTIRNSAELHRVNEEFALTRDKKSESVVRFNIPNAPEAARLGSMSPKTAKAKESGNIHQGLFHWIQDDEMFLTEEKIKEQNAIDEEQERRAREAPMPLRFFTAAADIDGGERGLKKVSDALFG